MHARSTLFLFAFAVATTTLAGCERRAPEPGGGNAHSPAPINPVAKGIDAPVEPAPAPAH